MNNESCQKQKRTSRGSANDAKSQYWCFLFDNLKSAVGYIYSMCEQDGDIEECKEAIMVLHNRIKEFEGLIQYIEVQASYEASAERPNSVAWEVPVSAIKQPSLPFPGNGDPQLFYYPYLPPQPYQYQVPGPYPPLMDPNVVNFIPYNQQFPPGFPPPPDFMKSGQQFPPPPQAQFPPFPPEYGHKKSGYGGKGHRRKGGHDGYNKPSKSTLNTLDPAQDVPAPAVTTAEQTPTPAVTSIEETPVTPAAPVEPIPASPVQETVTTPVELSEDSADKTTSHADQTTSPAPEEEAPVEAVLEKQTEPVKGEVKEEVKEEVKDEVKSDLKGEVKGEVKDEVKEEVRVSPEPAEIEPASGVVVAKDPPVNHPPSETTGDNITSTENITPDPPKAAEKELEPSTIEEENDKEVKPAETKKDEDPAVVEKEETPAAVVDSEFELKHATSTDFIVINKKLTEAINDNGTSKPPADSNVAPVSPETCPTATSPDLSGSPSERVSPDTASPPDTTSSVRSGSPPDKVSSTSPTAPDKSRADWTMVSEPLSSSSSDNFVHVGSDGSAHSLPTSPDVSEGKGEEAPEGVRENTVVPVVENTVESPEKKASGKKKMPEPKPTPGKSGPKSDLVSNPSPAKSEPAPEKGSGRVVKISASSSAEGDPGGKEVDVLSESGLSTMSSSSVHSCISLPCNPLARSTSWADLVRKGKSESPVPVAVPAPKKQVSSRYQSTPSRYLSHVQPTNEAATKRQVTTVNKSRSLPLSSRPVRPPRASHISEDGWSVSSGKSRVKTIPNKGGVVSSSEATRPVKTTSPHLTQRVVKAKPAAVEKTKPELGPRTKSSDSLEKSRTSRTTVAKPRPVMTKPAPKTGPNQSGPKPGPSKPLKKPLASSKPAAKPSTSKPLPKAKSLESTNKLEEKGKASKGASKTSETLAKGDKKGDKKAPKAAPVSSTVPTVNVPPPTLPIASTPALTSSEDSSPSPNMALEKTPTAAPTTDTPTTDTPTTEASTPSTVDSLPGEEEAVIPGGDTPREEVDEMEREVSFESKSIQTETISEEYPYYPTSEQQEDSSIYRVMISKRKRQISEHSSISTETLEEEERTCLSPGRSPGRSPSSRSSGGGRSPGKAPQLHQRLSSPSRRRTTGDNVLKNYQERLAKAQVKRDQIQEEKANKLKRIKLKEEQIRDLHEQQEKERAVRAAVHAEKLARAEQLRDQKIAEVKRKAQEEDMKVNEIAFINSLEAQNRKMELLSKEQLADAKRAEIQEERKRRSEELHAKEEAVMERKQAIEADRLARIASIEDKIRVSQERVDLNKMEMERGAREKALERDVVRELIRHDRGDKKTKSSSKLKEMQEKAAMLSRNLIPDYLPAHTLYDPPRWCSACSVKIVSEAVLMSHMIKRHRASTQLEAEKESQFIIDYSDELCPLANDDVTRQKMLRKRAKKVKTRITNKIPELPPVKLADGGSECPNRNRLTKCIKAMASPKTREKGLGDLSRTVLTRNDVNHLIEKGVVEQLCGFLPEKKLLPPVSKLLLHSCSISPTGAQICSRHLPNVVDSLTSSVALPAVQLDLTRLTTALIHSLPPCDSLTLDMVCFLVCREIVDTIHDTCTRTTRIKDEATCASLLASLELLSACCVAATPPDTAVCTVQTKNDPSNLAESLVFTKMCNIVTLLYGVLLYDGPLRSPSPLSTVTLRVVRECLTTLLHIARFSLFTLQSVLDSEGMSLELRHVCNYLLTCATHYNYTEILDLCIQLIGYVVFSHPSNQILLQNGPSPSILQLLTSLPFSYFSDVKSMNLLFPTLISACYECPSNIVILQRQVNKVMLIAFLKEQLSDKSRKHINHYPRATFQAALRFLEAPTETQATTPELPTAAAPEKRLASPETQASLPETTTSTSQTPVSEIEASVSEAQGAISETPASETIAVPESETPVSEIQSDTLSSETIAVPESETREPSSAVQADTLSSETHGVPENQTVSCSEAGTLGSESKEQEPSTAAAPEVT